MKIWQKEKISVEKLQKKLNLRESKRLDVLLNDVSAKMLCLSEIRLYDNLPLLSNKAGLLENKRGLLFSMVFVDLCGGFSSVDGATIYIGGSDNRQKSFRGFEVQKTG